MRYHLNPETGNAGLCRAKKKCRFGTDDEHYPTPEAARRAYELSQEELTPARNREPILLEPTEIPAPHQWHLTNNLSILTEATDSDEVDYYSKDYSEPTQLDLDKAIEIGINLRREDWPEGLQSLVEEHRSEWEDLKNWTFDLGFYEGDSPEFSPPTHMEKTLQSYYYAQPNAVDHYGVLEHVREKGCDTSGLTPLEAVKAMLREENGMRLRRVEEARWVTVAKKRFSDFSYATQHFDRIEPSEPRPASPRSSVFTGVVWNGGGGHRMVDGHHRLKWALSKGEDSGTFIILHR